MLLSRLLSNLQVAKSLCQQCHFSGRCLGRYFTSQRSQKSIRGNSIQPRASQGHMTAQALSWTKGFPESKLNILQSRHGVKVLLTKVLGFLKQQKFIRGQIRNSCKALLRPILQQGKVRTSSRFPCLLTCSGGSELAPYMG